MADNLRKLKDEAAKLAQKGKFDKALKLYQEILEMDAADLTAQLKCGDLLRKLKRDAEAIAYYTKVAQTYAEDGLLLKAIAACKLILEIDDSHTDTQQMLAGLYAKKTGRAAAVAQFVARAVPAPAPAPAQAVAIEPEAAAAAAPGAPEAELPAIPAIPLFSDLTKNAFIQLMEQMTMRTVAAGEVVIREGESGDSMFIISHGRVKVTKTSETGEELLLARLHEGAFFGEMALLSDQPRSASVVAEDESTLFAVSRDVLAEVVANFPSVRHILLRFYRQRLLSNLMLISPVFKPLGAEQRKSLIEMFKSRELEANEQILEEGQRGDGLYLILSGQVEVSKRRENKETVVGRLAGGDLFGEMSLLHNQPVTATVKTVKKSIILKLPRKYFAEIVSTHPQLVEVMAALSDEREKISAAVLAGKMAVDEGGLHVV